jgi:hypothetical protein
VLLNKSTITALLDFYKAHPECVSIILTEGEYCLRVWDQIFIWFYKATPKDSKSVPPHYKKGATDPHWDELLHAREGLSAHTFVVRVLQRRAKYKQATEKAA